MTSIVGWRRSIVVAVAMFAASALGVIARPSTPIKDTGGEQIRLERMVPAAFGIWKVDPTVVPIAPSPDQQKVLDATYDQTLSRTYIDDRGDRVMLSIAYGGRHGEGMQTHRPEICYPAQGFQVFKEAMGTLVTRYGSLPIKRLVAAHGARNEPITYWVVVGEQQTHFGIWMKLAQVKYGLMGKIPDGMLVRVSSVQGNEQRAYELHEEFVRSLLDAMSVKDRLHIAGRFG